MKKMKYIKEKSIALVFIVCTMFSCSLDEYNPAEISENEALQKFENFYGLTNYCYQPIYSQLFTASDYLSTTEAGTDLWITANNATNTQQLFYYESLATSTNAIKKLWLQAYSTINICNKVIARADGVKDGSPSDINTLKAEAHCLRAFYYSILVEQYGEITLSLKENTEDLNFSPQRNSIEEIYAQIVSDLRFAVTNLDVEPYKNNYGRVCKKTALGLLCRAYIQGAGYDLIDQETGKSYLQLAKETAEDFITNEAAYGGYMYDTFEEVWLQKNNRGNKEALFSATGATYGSEAGKYSTTTSLYRYFFPNTKNFTDLGMIQNGYFYGRANASLYVPTKYLLDVFEEGDDRYDKSFISAFSTYSYNRTGSAVGSTSITPTICTNFGIDPSWVGTVLGPQVDILDSGWKYDAVSRYNYPYEADPTNTINGWKTVADDKSINLYTELNEPAINDLRVRMYFSRKSLSATEKAQRPYYTLSMDNIYDANGMHISSSANGKDQHLWPGLIKFSHYEPDLWATYQNKTGDVMIMRMAEIYLIAAEANVRLGQASDAVPFLNKLRERAEKPSYDLSITASDVDLDFVLDEYAREMCGEFNRWYILKRNHAFETRLPQYNTRAASSFKTDLHYVRPISQDFLNQIDNPEEYGTNGYQ